MNAYDTAVRMFDREHDRWNQWALFFFGSIVSVFVIAGQAQLALPLWLPWTLASLLSITWFLVAVGIRASTHAWRQTVKTIENNGGLGRPFEIVEAELAKFSRWREVLDTLRFLSWPTWTSVTRMLMLLGLLAAILFAVVAVATATGWLSPAERQVRTCSWDDSSGSLPNRRSSWGLWGSSVGQKRCQEPFCSL